MPTIVETTHLEELTQTYCLGELRWVPLNYTEFGIQRKLQQKFVIIKYQNGRPSERIEEWRDVPTVS